MMSLKISECNERSTHAALIGGKNTLWVELILCVCVQLSVLNLAKVNYLFTQFCVGRNGF